MNPLDALFLGIFQGITEFLPISSSGHLIIAEHFFDLPAEKFLAFDAVLHGGSLLSLVLVFWKQIQKLLSVPFSPSKATSEDRRLFWLLIAATLPAGIVGILAENWFISFRSIFWVGVFSLMSAGIFLLAEYSLRKKMIFHLGNIFTFMSPSLKERRGENPVKKEIKFPWVAGMTAGFMQILALLPGISRSGTTTAVQMFFGISRYRATEFSFLLGLPIIAAVFLLQLWRIFQGETDFSFSWAIVGIGFFASALTGFFVARFLLHFFQKHSLLPFSIYLLLLGSILLFLTVE